MDAALHLLRETFGDSAPEIGIILGSGLGSFAQEALTPVGMLNYADIPDWQTSTVQGHRGRLIVGEVHGRRVVCMQGRLHLYEGYSPEEVTFPIRILQAWGVKTLVVTNAAGGIREDLCAGSFMLIEDHMNFTGMNPLMGAQLEGERRFPDMTHAYDPELLEQAAAVAQQFPMDVFRGVYIGVNGPSFETPAEIRAFRTLGADAVGMSTVSEVIVANQLGMRVLGISLISNRAAGLSGEALSEDEVNETAARVQQPFAAFLAACIRAF